MEKIPVTNTETGKTVSVDVAYRTNTSVTVYLAGEKIVLIKQGKHFVGNKFGMELVYTP